MQGTTGSGAAQAWGRTASGTRPEFLLRPAWTTEANYDVSSGSNRAVKCRRTFGAETMLNAREVAERIGMGKDWVYSHAGEIPGSWRKRKVLRFSSAAVEAWKRGVR